MLAPLAIIYEGYTVYKVFFFCLSSLIPTACKG